MGTTLHTLAPNEGATRNKKRLGRGHGSGLHKTAGKVLLKPASAGTGVIAGGAVRNVLEVAGVQDILTKCIGTSNPHNVIHATIDALQQLRSADQIVKSRGKTLDSLHA